ncbi:MAG: putative molybdenum carrier protein [Pseudomonadota bacterium]|nr:putative molybdenum carrier protein [Pseudomonadota bacterium]
MIEKIVSGGQTGVDRGALDGALSLNFPCGGWCPEGRRAEDGVIDPRYPVQVLAGAGSTARTKKNVLDSDGTLLIFFNYMVVRGGTEQTLMFCINAKKPYLLLDGHELSVARAAEKINDFVKRYNIRTLNVAGPRGAKLPQAQPYTAEVIREYLQLADPTLQKLKESNAI